MCGYTAILPIPRQLMSALVEVHAWRGVADGLPPVKARFARNADEVTLPFAFAVPAV